MARLHTRRPNASSGFTIVELLIATAVFGVVLLLITTAILQISRLYYKGVTESRTQAAARAAIDTISQGMQFNSGTITTTNTSPTSGSSYAFCVGGQQYSYTIGYQVADAPTSSQSYHGLIVDSIAGCTSSTPAQNVRTAGVTGRELLTPGMRLSKMDVAAVGTNLYKVTIKVVSGDDDLLNNPNAANASCKALRAGTQFCAISELTTVVTKRVE